MRSGPVGADAQIETTAMHAIGDTAMTVPVYSSSSDWYCEGRQASYLRARKSPGGSRVSGDLGGGRFDLTGKRGDFCLAAPNFSTTAIMEENHRLRSLAFPMAQWESVLDEAADGRFSFDSSFVYDRMFASPAIRSAFRKLWVLCEDEGAPSRLLARAAGCEILAELCRLGGAPLATAKGGLTPWAQRRCLELMRTRLSEDMSLDELAAEAQLSPFHFARMFKQSLGVPPRVYLTRLRMEKACELLERTDLPITKIALEVGYSSNQVLARVFLKHIRLSPSDYRRAVRDRARPLISLRARPALEGRQ